MLLEEGPVSQRQDERWPSGVVLSNRIEASRKLAMEYSSIAAEYERHWAPVIRPMALHLVAALPLARASRILDLGCGTGSLLWELQYQAPGSHIIGADRAEGMLRCATRSSSSSLMVADAEQLGLQDRSIDVAVLAFMLFHVPDPSAALREVKRTLRNGGIIGIAAWGDDPGLPGASIWLQELDASGASPDPRDALVMNQARMNTLEQLSALLCDAGFYVQRVWHEMLVCEFTVEQLLALQTTCGMASRRLATLPSEEQAACKERANRRIRSLSAPELVYRAEVLFAVAERPA